MSFYPACAARTLGAMRADFARDHGVMVDRSNSNRPERNTLRVVMPDGSQVVRLHATDILKVDRHGVLTLDSGGYQTVTTKDRLNSYLPAGFYVYADKGWHIHTPKGVFPFADQAKFKPDGTPCNPKTLERNGKRIDARKALVAKFLKKAKAEGWADPAGDPWCFGDPGEEVMMNWLQTGYFTRRLCVMALEKRFQPMGVALHINSMERNGGRPDGYLVGQLRRFIYSQIGLPV